MNNTAEKKYHAIVVLDQDKLEEKLNDLKIAEAQRREKISRKKKRKAKTKKKKI